MVNMKLLEVVTPPSIYHSCSIGKTFREEKFIGEEKFTLGDITAVNMKNCGRHNVRKHTEIKVSDKYVILDILLDFGSMDKMRITSSEPKDNVGISEKGFNNSLGIKAKSGPKKLQNSRYSIKKFSMKYL